MQTMLARNRKSLGDNFFLRSTFLDSDFKGFFSSFDNSCVFSSIWKSTLSSFCLEFKLLLWFDAFFVLPVVLSTISWDSGTMRGGFSSASTLLLTVLPAFSSSALSDFLTI